VLDGSTSVFVQSTTPGQASPFIRGLTGSSVLSLIDGMRLNHAMYRSAPNQDLALVDPYMIESISVLYGPNSVRYGSDALGGVVYARTRQPHLGEDDVKARGIVRYDTADLMRVAHSHVEATSEKFGAIVGASAQDTGNRVVGGSSQRLGNSGYSSYSGFMNFAVEPTAHHRTNLSVQYLRQPETPRFDELVPGFGQDEPSSAEFFFKPNERFASHLEQIVKNVNSSIIDEASFDFSYQRIRDDRQQRNFDSVVQTNEENRSQMFEVAANADLSITEATKVSYGLDGSHDTISSSRLETDLDTESSEFVEPRFPDDSTRGTVGIYSFVESEVVEDLSLSAGARYSHIRLKLAETAATNTSRFSINDVSWSTGLRYAIVEDVDFVSSISRGFRAPNVFDMGALGPRPGNRFNVANTSLDPEELYSYDVGLQTKQERVAADIHFFLSQYNDKIASEATGETTADGRQVVQSQNIAESITYGTESSLLVMLCEDFDLKGNVSWTWGENEIAGVEESGDRIPPLFGNTSLEWRVVENVKLEPYLKFAREQSRLSARDQDDPRVNPEGTAGWLITGVSSSWEFKPGYTVAAALNNIGDKNYRVHGSGIDSPGRSVMMMLDVAL
jgi:outer membrane receptor protein involved in Fe transport